MQTWEIVVRKPKPAPPPRKLKMPKKLEDWTWTNQRNKEQREVSLNQESRTLWLIFLLTHSDQCAPHDLLQSSSFVEYYVVYKKIKVIINKKASMKLFLRDLQRDIGVSHHITSIKIWLRLVTEKVETLRWYKSLNDNGQCLR